MARVPTHPVRALCLCAATFAVTLSGCAADRLKTVAPRDAPRLAGNWTLDPSTSEPLHTAVIRLQTQLRGLMRRARHAARAAEHSRRAPRASEPPRQDRDHDERTPPATDTPAGEAGPLQEPGVEVSAPLFGAAWMREFIARVPVGDYLGIGIAPGVFTVRSAGGSQQCDLGVPTAVTFGEGTADQTCGWRGSDFLIELRPRIGPELTERFALEPGGELMMSLHLTGNGIDVRLIRRYRRTPRAVAPALLPTSD